MRRNSGLNLCCWIATLNEEYKANPNTRHMPSANSFFLKIIMLEKEKKREREKKEKREKKRKKEKKKKEKITKII